MIDERMHIYIYLYIYIFINFHISRFPFTATLSSDKDSSKTRHSFLNIIISPNHCITLQQSTRTNSMFLHADFKGGAHSVGVVLILSIINEL